MQTRAINPTPWLQGFNINHGVEVTGVQRTLYLSGHADPGRDIERCFQYFLCAGCRLRFQAITPEEARGLYADVQDVARCIHPSARRELHWAEAGMTPANVVRLNMYTTDVDGLMGAAAELVGVFAADGCSPVSTLLGVTRLFEPSIMVELEATAVA